MYALGWLERKAVVELGEDAPTPATWKRARRFVGFLGMDKDSPCPKVGASGEQIALHWPSVSAFISAPGEPSFYVHEKRPVVWATEEEDENTALVLGRILRDATPSRLGVR